MSTDSGSSPAARLRRRDLVQESWRKVSARAGVAGNAFYAALFAAHKAVIPLFTGQGHDAPKFDITRQAQALENAVTFVVDNLDKPALVKKTLLDLGKRHANYGVQADHFAVVGQILLATLKSALGDEFSPAANEAWTVTFGVISRTMIVGIAKARGEAGAAEEDTLEQSMDYMALFVDDGDGVRARHGAAV